MKDRACLTKLVEVSEKVEGNYRHVTVIVWFVLGRVEYREKVIDQWWNCGIVSVERRRWIKSD